MPLLQRCKEFALGVFHKISHLNDTPHKIALGFGLGVFLGILPGTGPIAALLIAGLIRVNQPAALLGGLLTNTWLSLVTFVLSAKIGSAVLGLEWSEVYEVCQKLVKDFQFKYLFDVSIMTILKPLLIGYFIVGLSLGILCYFLVLGFIYWRKYSKKKLSS